LSKDEKLYLKGDIMVLGVDGSQEAVVEGVKYCGGSKEAWEDCHDDDCQGVKEGSGM
jgi:hypothetical protein